MSAVRNTARAIVLHDGNILLMERWRPGLHYFSIPGGGIEPGETPEQTALREVAEETGCVVRLQRQVYTLQFVNGDQHFIFLADFVSGEPNLLADSPEAQEDSADNRFKPGWMPLADLSNLDLLVWSDLKGLILQGVSSGFPETPQTLASGY